MDSDCFFCREIENHIDNILGRSRIVLETENFVVFPTVGCFQIGYLLIMPKQHFLCFGELDSNLIDELDDIILNITNYVQRKQGKKCIIFEHGTRDLSKLTTTSVMHAHIHVIPFENDFVSYLPTYCELKKIKGFADLAQESDNYLYLQDINGNQYIVKNDNYPSQFFRQVACNAMGISKYWNWRDYAFKENLEITIDYYNELYMQEA